MGASLTGVMMVAFATLNWSLSGIAQRRAFGEPGVTANQMVLFSSTINAVVLWVLVAFSALWQSPPAVRGPGVVLFMIGGLVGTVLGRLFIANGIARVGAARSATTKVSGPVVSLVIAWMVLGEVLSLQTLGGIALVLGGVLVLLTERLPASAPGGVGAASVAVAHVRPTDYLWGFAGAACFAVADNFRKVGLGLIPWAAFGSAVGVTTAAASMIVAQAIAGRLHDVRGLGRGALLWLTAQGLAMAVASLSTFAALLRVEVAVVSTILATEPLVTMFLGRFVLGRSDGVTPRLYAAALLVILGAALITLRHL